MSLFGKKPISQQPPTPYSSELEPPPAVPSGGYGIADLIRLMKAIPLDEHPELVVRVIRTTLESVGVQGDAVARDAVRQEDLIEERIGCLVQEIEGLSEEIRLRRETIVDLRSQFAETRQAKERLLQANVALVVDSKPDALRSETPSTRERPRSLPPPLPPPIKNVV